MRPESRPSWAQHAMAVFQTRYRRCVDIEGFRGDLKRRMGSGHVAVRGLIGLFRGILRTTGAVCSSMWHWN